jgi:hypothetical protein
MNLQAYLLIEPDLDSPLGKELGNAADHSPSRLARMCNAIDAFMLDPHIPGYRLAPGTPEVRYEPESGVEIEVYIVPRVFYAAACCLLRVSHVERTVSFLEVHREYGGPDETLLWKAIIERATNEISGL